MPLCTFLLIYIEDIYSELKDEIEMAYATQEVYERILQSHQVRKLPAHSDYPGGCALNKQANPIESIGTIHVPKNGDPVVIGAVDSILKTS